MHLYCGNCVNFRDLWSYAKIKPAVLQVELHPMLQQKRLVNMDIFSLK